MSAAADVPQPLRRPARCPPRRAGADAHPHGALRRHDAAPARARHRAARPAAGRLRLAGLRQRRAQRADAGSPTRTTGSPTPTPTTRPSTSTFGCVAEDVNDGLRRCGFSLDPHGVLAQQQAVAHVAGDVAARSSRRSPRRRATWTAWRAPASPSTSARSPASSVACALTDIMREAPAAPALHERPGAARDARCRSPLAASARRLVGIVDIKKDGLRAHPEPGALLRVRQGDHRPRPRWNASSRCARSNGQDDGVDADAARGVHQHVAPAAAPSRQRHARRPAARQHDRRRDPAPAHPGRRCRRRCARSPRRRAASRGWPRAEVL